MRVDTREVDAQAPGLFKGLGTTAFGDTPLVAAARRGALGPALRLLKVPSLDLRLFSQRDSVGRT